MVSIKNVLRSFFDPDTAPGRGHRLEVFDSLVEKLDQEMSRTNQADKLGVMRSCQEGLRNMPTRVLIAVDESFPFAEDGIIDFIRALSMNNADDIRVAAHYHPSGLVYMYSAPIMLKQLRSSLETKTLPLHVRDSLEYKQMLAVIKVAIAAVKQGQARLSTSYYEASIVKPDSPASDFIPPQLADAIMAHYDRVDDIIEIMKAKNVTPQQLHPDLLLDYLNAESKPLAEGIL